MVIRLSRIWLDKANTAKIAQYVDRVIYLGKRNLLFRIDVRHLYSIWNLCRTEEDYKYALTATNHFYNFGRQLTPEALDKLFITTLRCNQTEEAIQLISGSSDWQRRPPSLHLVYVLLSELASKGDFEKLFRVFKAVRTSWQLPLTSTLYDHCINFMLNKEDHALEDSLLVYGDSEAMGVMLSEETHSALLESALKHTENREMCKTLCLYIINRMMKELQRLSSSKTYYLLSWFAFRFKDEKESITFPKLRNLATDWKSCLEYSMELAYFSDEKPKFCDEFVQELGPELESFKKN